MLLGLKMQEKFTWVLENFSSLRAECCCSPPFKVAGCNWRLLAYPRGVRNDRYGYLSVYLDLSPGSLPPGWRREVKYRITLVNISPQLNKVLGGQCCFDAKSTSFGFEDFLPLYRLRNRFEGFLVNDRITILAEVHVFPAIVVPLQPLKIITSLSSKETNQASVVSKSQGDSLCQVAPPKSDNSASQENLDDDDDDASQEDPDDNDASSPVYDDGGKEDADDEASTLVLNDSARNVSSIDQMKFLEDASQAVEGRGFNNVASVTESCNNVLKEIQPVKETKNINGSNVVSSKLESVRGESESHQESLRKALEWLSIIEKNANHNKNSSEKTDNAASQENLDDDDASEEGTDDDDDDDSSEEDTDDDDDDASEEGTDDDDDDDDSSEEDTDDDDDASEEGTDGDDDDDASEESLDDDASQEDPKDDEASSLILNDNARNGTTLDQVKSLENASQAVENGVASVTETSNIILKEIQPVKETMDINGFEIVSSKVECVRRIFERHPDIAVEFRAKNQHLRNACMNFLLSLIETMCQSLEELSNEDIVEADIALTYLRDAGFKVDWLEKKLDQLKEKKEEEKAGLARLHEVEENLKILKQKWSDLDALAEKEKAELSETRTSMSFDDLVC